MKKEVEKSIKHTIEKLKQVRNNSVVFEQYNKIDNTIFSLQNCLINFSDNYKKKIIELDGYVDEIDEKIAKEEIRKYLDKEPDIIELQEVGNETWKYNAFSVEKI